MMIDCIDGTRNILLLTFPPEVAGSPVICHMSQQHSVSFSILQAQITPRKEGHMTVELCGPAPACQAAMVYLREQGVRISHAKETISRDEVSCVHCGMCTAICPSDSLHMDTESREVIFDADRCTACGMCTRICPVKAMRVEVDTDELP